MLNILTKKNINFFFKSFLQGIIPRAVNDRVSELMVAEDKKEDFLKEAETLPSVEITKIDLQWVQVLGEGWASPLNGKYLFQFYCNLLQLY